MQWTKLVQGSRVSVFGARYVGLSRIIAARTSSLWPPYGIGQAIIFLPFDLYLLLLSFFLAQYQRSGIGCLPYFNTWRGLSANLECMSEMCSTRLSKNTRRKKSQFRHHRASLSDCIFATKAYIDNPKKRVKHR